MQVPCPACQLTIDVAQSSSGMRINCPGCGEAFRIPAEQRVLDPSEVWISDGDSSPRPPSPNLATSAAAPARTKTCPMCGAAEQADARRCRSCGEVLAGFQGPDGYPIEGVWRDGNRLVMAKNALLPGICVQTNQPTGERLRRKLYWHSPWVYILLISPLIYIIVALIARQTADIQIGLCRERIVRRRWIIASAWLGVFLGIGIFIKGVSSSEPSVPILPFVGLLLFLGAMIAGVVMARIVVPMRITSRYAWLKGVNAEYLAALPPFPGDQ